MTEKAMDMGAVSVNLDTKGNMRRHSTGEVISGGSLLSSTSKEKPLPRYLRASTGSCHDFCKYGQKHAFESEAKPPFLPKLGNKAIREEPHQVNNSNLEERRKRLVVKLKSSCHQKTEFPDKPAVSKQKAASKIKKAGLAVEHVNVKLQFFSSTRKSSISSDQEVPPTSANEETQVKGINLEDEKKKQMIKSKTLIKSHPSSYKHKVGEQKDLSPDNGIGAHQKSVIIKRDTSLLQEATSSVKPKLVKQTSTNSCSTHDQPQNLKQEPSVPNEVTQVNSKHVTSKKVSRTPAVVVGSPHTLSYQPTGRKNEKEKFVNSREITKMAEKKMLKPSIVSPSLKHIGDGISSLKQRQHKHGKETTPTKSQNVGKAEYDTQNNEEKTLYAIDEIPEKVALDSAEQTSPKVENVVPDSSKEPLSKCENSDMDFLQQKLLKPENADMGVLGQKLLEPDNTNFDSLEVNPDDQKLLEPKNVDLDFLEQRLLNPEKADHDTLEPKPDYLKLLEPENADMNFLEQNLLKLEETGLESLEMEATDRNLLEAENGDMNLPEQKLLVPYYIDLHSMELKHDDHKLLEQENSDMISVEQRLKPENIDLDSLELKHNDYKLLKQENADMNSLEQKLVKPENIDLDSLELKPNDHKLLEQENADMNFLGQKLLKPENIDLDSLELKHNDHKLLEQENADMNSLEQKLLKPENIDLDSLELKANDHKLLEQENADMNFLEQKLLKPENIDLDSLELSLELKPSDDQSSQSTTDDEEEIEESESASSEPTELELDDEVKENNGNCESLKGEERRRAGRNAAVHLEDKLSTPHKLKFRRGKIIELQPESNGPRRLRFRRGRTVGGSVNGGKIERKNFQRNEMSEAVVHSSPEAQGIVLKHQDMQEKKDAQGLFNNVIEETASKLVETRKSKVKALVGAFETVISLQDIKPEATA